MHYAQTEHGVLNSVGLLLFQQLPTKLAPHLVYTLAEFINFESTLLRWTALLVVWRYVFRCGLDVFVMETGIPFVSIT